MVLGKSVVKLPIDPRSYSYTYCPRIIYMIHVHTVYSRVGHESGPSTGRIGSGWVGLVADFSLLRLGRIQLCGSLWVTLEWDDTECNCKF